VILLRCHAQNSAIKDARRCSVVRSVADKYDVEDLQIRNAVTYVGLADERLVIKAPKSVQNMASLAVEAAALELLDRSQPFPVAVPQIVEFSTDPVFLVTTYLPGNIIEAATLQDIPLKERTALGHDIGTYVLAQAEQVNVAAARREIPPLDEADTWEKIFEGVIGNFSSPTFPSTTKLAQQLYGRWLEYQNETMNEQFIQGDLRLGNMTVTHNNRLRGVFDFGRAGVGNASNEISPLVNLDRTIMQAAIDELQAASVEIDMDQIHVWDEMKKVTQLVHYINVGTYHHDPPLFVSRACHILSTHHPELAWGEFNTLHV